MLGLGIGARLRCLKDALHLHARLDSLVGEHAHAMGPALARARALGLLSPAEVDDAVRVKRLGDQARHGAFAPVVGPGTTSGQSGGGAEAKCIYYDLEPDEAIAEALYFPGVGGSDGGCMAGGVGLMAEGGDKLYTAREPLLDEEPFYSCCESVERKGATRTRRKKRNRKKKRRQHEREVECSDQKIAPVSHYPVLIVVYGEDGQPAAGYPSFLHACFYEWRRSLARWVRARARAAALELLAVDEEGFESSEPFSDYAGEMSDTMD